MEERVWPHGGSSASKPETAQLQLYMKMTQQAAKLDGCIPKIDEILK